MGHYECKKCGQHYDYCDCRKTRAIATSTTDATFERRAGDSESLGQLSSRVRNIVNSKPPPSARGSVTVRRPDGTTITCDVAQLQEVLEQVHKVRPRTVEVTGTYHSPVPGDE